MLGKDASYEALPYFYTDQYDLSMEYVGHVSGGYYEVVVRGDLDARQFIAFWLKDGRVKAGMNVNIWDVTDSGQGADPVRAPGRRGGARGLRHRPRRPRRG